MLYLLTRAEGRRDLATGQPFDASSSLHVQELFPKAALKAAGYGSSEVNAIANIAFVARDSATQLGSQLPEAFLAECSAAGLRAHWIPEDPALWSVDRYPEFLAARRELLAEAADHFLTELMEGTRPWGQAIGPMPPPIEDESGARAAQLRALVDEFSDLGYATPALDCEIPDPETGQTLAVAEAFWADGLQVGQGPPVVLELDPEEADLARLAELGCEVFTSVDALRAHVQRRGELAGGDRTDEGTVHAVAGSEPEPIVGPAPTPPADEVPDDEPVDGSTPLADEFDGAVLALVDQCVKELRYNPRYFRVMISQHGALGATRRLLAAPAVSDGFVKLWEHQRLDLTAEALVIEPRFAALFTDSEQKIARSRLDDFGYSGAA